MNEVSRLELRRRENIEAIKEKARTGGISIQALPLAKHVGDCANYPDFSACDILQETARLERNPPQTKIEPFHFEALLEAHLSTHYSVDLTLQNEFLEQSRLESRLCEANAGFTTRKLGTSTLERKVTLQALENGYFKYRGDCTKFGNRKKDLQ